MMAGAVLSRVALGSSNTRCLLYSQVCLCATLERFQISRTCHVPRHQFTEEIDSTVSPARATCDYGEILIIATKIALKYSPVLKQSSVLQMPSMNVLFKLNESYL